MNVENTEIFMSDDNLDNENEIFDYECDEENMNKNMDGN